MSDALNEVATDDAAVADDKDDATVLVGKPKPSDPFLGLHRRSSSWSSRTRRETVPQPKPWMRSLP